MAKLAFLTLARPRTDTNFAQMPKTVHQRVPIVCGSKDDVLECRKYYQASTDKELAKRCLSRLAPGQEITSLTSLVDLVAVDTNGDGQVDALVERKSEGG